MSQLLFSMDGRIGVKQFWVGLASGLASSFCLAVVVGLVMGVGLIAMGASPAQQDTAAYVCGGIVAVYAAYTQLAVTVKRCHDQGRSGWWCLLMLVPFVGLVWLVLDLGTQPGIQDRTPR